MNDTDQSQTNVCLSCSKALTKDGGFCPYCGAAISTMATVDTQIQKKIDLELGNRLKDQSAMVRELADKVEDIVWKRVARYTVLLGLLISVIVGVFTFYGITTFKDASSKIEPIVQAAVKKAETAKQNVEKSASKVDTLKTGIDQLSTSLDLQKRRVTEKTSEISTKLAAFDATQKQMEASLQRATAMSQQVDALQKSLQARVQQTSSQVDDISLRRAYPDFGKTMYVALNGLRWRGKEEKKPEEMWVNLDISPTLTGRFTRAN